MHWTPWSATCAAMLVAMVAIYFWRVRPYLKTLPQFAEVWRREQTCWDALVAWASGRKTILIGIWGSIIGYGPDALQFVSGLDLKLMLGLNDLWAAWVSAIIPLLMTLMRAMAKPEE